MSVLSGTVLSGTIALFFSVAFWISIFSEHIPNKASQHEYQNRQYMNMNASLVCLVVNDVDSWFEKGRICSARSTKASRILLLSSTVRSAFG